MPYVMKAHNLYARNQENGEYLEQNVIAEEATSEKLEQIQSEAETQMATVTQHGNDVIQTVQNAISESQTAVGNLEEQKQTIVQSVASMAELGTDTTLSTSGMAADAEATGDAISRSTSQLMRHAADEYKLNHTDSPVFFGSAEEWEAGYINLGQETDDAGYLRTKSGVFIPKDTIVHAEAGSDYYVLGIVYDTFGKNGHRSSSNIFDPFTVTKFDYTATEDCYIRLVTRKRNDDTNITPIDSMATMQITSAPFTPVDNIASDVSDLNSAIDDNYETFSGTMEKTRNILDMSKMWTGTKNGITVSYEDGHLVINGTASAQFSEYSENLSLTPGEQYTACAFASENKTISGYIRTWDSSNNILQTELISNTNTPVTFTVNANAVRVVWSFGAPANASYSNLAIYCEIDKSASISSYIPHFIPNDITARKQNEVTQEELDELENVLIISQKIENSDLLTGKYYLRNGSTGAYYTTDSSGSRYTNPIDLTDFNGGILTIKISSLNTSGTRIFGFADSNGILTEYWMERDTEIFSLEDGVYVARMVIKYPQFVFSYTNGPTISLSFVATKSSVPEKVYVDGTNGSDADEGTTEEPYKTISRAVRTGARNIFVKAGTYTEKVNLSNISHDISIKLWQMPTFDESVPALPKIIISGGENRTIDYGIFAENCHGIHLEDIVCTMVSAVPFWIKNTQFVECIGCVASETVNDNMGFQLTNVNGRFVNCEAYNISKDGFNIHGYGNTEFIDCIGHDCGDDGISHHDGCTGYIRGGEYYNCAKGGVASPTYGAYIDVDGVYSHDNKYGIYAVSTTGRQNVKSRISNSIFIDNTETDLYMSAGTYIMWNCVYSTKNIYWNATLTEYKNN